VREFREVRRSSCVLLLLDVREPKKIFWTEDDTGDQSGFDESGVKHMSRSKKRKPYFAVGKGRNDSDTFDKRITHKLFRHRANTLLAKEEYDLLPLRHDEVRSEWDFRSDGPKTYWKEATMKELRK
jgi:hypothetical protein